MSTLGLDPERLSSLDEHGHHKTIIPAEVKGHFRNLRNWTQAVLILIFLILPWTKINGAQTLLLDIANRKFAIFGITYWAHDGPLIFFILAALGLTLFFVTSLWGRIWCGWACPQTVFIDGVFRRIEILIEGNYIQRRQMLSGDLTFPQNLKRILKWLAFFLVSSVIAHSFTAYFVGAEALAAMTIHSPTEHMTPFVWVTVMTFIILFDFGWFREQFCIIMCPYGRFQSVLMDKNSLAVIYDNKRGEPRKAGGDCVACNRCVQVCPTGIDIRKGVQMECITCTACIDACDEIMVKVKKPTGLIRYDSVSQQRGSLFQPRSLIYLTLIFASLSGLAYNVLNRQPLEAAIIRAKDTPYQILPAENNEPMILNHFKAHITNQGFVPGQYQIMATAEAAINGVIVTTAENPIQLISGQNKTIHVFVKFPAKLTNQIGQASTSIEFKDLNPDNKNYIQRKEISIVGPIQSEPQPMESK